MKRIWLIVLCLLTLSTHTSVLTAEPVSGASLSAGRATVQISNRHSYGKSFPDMPVEKLRDFAFGNRLFNTQWVIAPASVKSLDGLGPLFNRSSCAGCHTRDGRGRTPIGKLAKDGKTTIHDGMMSMLVRLSVPGKAKDGGPKGHPVLGGQLNDRGIGGVPEEGRVTITYRTIKGAYADGEPWELREPDYQFHLNPVGGKIINPKELLFSPRVAPPVYGLGLLEVIPEKDILAQADPEDKDGDGISGKANYVPHVESGGDKKLGRFGWKSNQPSLKQQIAGAFLGDIGITSSLFPIQNAAPAQAEAYEAAKIGDKEAGGEPELSDAFLEKITFYNRHLAVPAFRNTDKPAFKQGKKLFKDIGCAACHTETFTTSKDAPPLLANQVIHPYSDLLVHDMGERLADNRPDFDATGTEWRTPPLWGIGLLKTVNGHTELLHDGRARNIEEAILWHGGEGEASRDRFTKLSKQARKALLFFLGSL